MNTFTELVDALDESWTATSSLAAELSAEEWEEPTGCPGWTVKDVLSHLVGLERLLLGEPMPDHEPPAYPHVRDDIGRFMEIAVDLRRPHDPASVLAEFDEVRAARIDALRAVDPPELETEIIGTFGTPQPAKRVLPIRVFDCWAHDQDMRRAVGRRGNQSGLAAEISVDRLTRGLRHNLPRRLELDDDVTVVFALTAPESSAIALRIGPREATVLDAPPAAPTIELELDLDTFVVLGCGRDGYRDVLADGAARATGDTDLAARLVIAMPVTP